MKENILPELKLKEPILENCIINKSDIIQNQIPKKECLNEVENVNKDILLPSLLKLPEKVDSEKCENEKDKNLKDSSDYEIDILTESSCYKKKDSITTINNNNTNNNIINNISNNINLGNTISHSINLGKNNTNRNDIPCYINEIEEINIDNDDNDNDNNSNDIIDISEEKNSTQSKESSKNDKDFILSESLRKIVPKSRFLRGHCPFNFFEKEKCKNMDFKKVNIRKYISDISAQWKKMTDKEKEPYVKLSEEFKKNYLANNNSEDSEEQKLISRKRRKKRKIIPESDNNNNTYTNVEINNSNNDNNKVNKKSNNFLINNNPIESFAIYTNNKNGKKNEVKLFETKKIDFSELKNYDQSGIGKNEAEKKSEKNEVNENVENKNMMIQNNTNTVDKMNEFINNILIPFVVKSFDFIKSLSTNNS